jgi:hypothetical protein
MYITQADYKSRLPDEDYTLLVGHDEQARIECERRAIGDAKSYLMERYNTDLIFERTGEERDPLVLGAVLDIALVYLWERVSNLNVPNVRRMAMERAMKLLKEVGEGSRYLDLPMRPDPESGEPVRTASLAVASNAKRKWRRP